MVRVSPRAEIMIRQLVERSDSPTALLRVDLREGGCCGTTYVFSVEPARDGDLTIGNLCLSPAATAVLKGAQLDYGPTLKPPRFRILRNPNISNRCPCGRSFGRPFPGKETPQCQAYVAMPWDDM